MQYLCYPLKFMRITQDYNGSTSHYKHSHSKDGIIDYSVDDGEKDTGCNDYFYAPCNLTIKKIYTAGTNTFWWESVDKVYLADGRESKVCGYVIHCPDSSLNKLKLNKIYKQGELLAQEGKDGATGFHFHHAVGLGEFKGGGWVKNSAGAWVLITTGGAIKPENAYWVNDNFTQILNAKGLKWKHCRSGEKIVESLKYYPKYTGSTVSIVSALSSLKIDSSFTHRKKIAAANGIKGYIGTSKQNTIMLNLLKSGKLRRE